VETGLYLADHGHEVTILTRQRELATDANQIHYIGALRDYYNARDSFHPVVNATTTLVAPGRVTFTVQKPPVPEGMPGLPGMPPMGGGDFAQPGPYSADGTYTLECDSVVVCGGVASCRESAMAFSESAAQFILAGDCNEPGRVYQSVRAGFAAGNQI